VRAEHDELREELERAIEVGGKVGEAAMKVYPAAILVGEYLKQKRSR
jgi:hypothetical protein